MPSSDHPLPRVGRGFSLVEMLVVVCIAALLTIAAVRLYQDHIIEALDKRTRYDLQELAKTIQLYNSRESEPFSETTFRPPFVGNYLSSAPSDPWGHPYRHNFDLGIVYSVGPDGLDLIASPGMISSLTPPDEIVFQYLPAEFFIRKAELIDANHNQRLDFGDRLRVTFSRTANLEQLQLLSFVTRDPENALGSAVVPPGQKRGLSAEIVFTPPVGPSITIGQTRLAARRFERVANFPSEAITDFSEPPKQLDAEVWVPIQWAK